MARLTLQEASRRKVVWALMALTVVLLGLSAWGFHSLAGMRASQEAMSSGETQLMMTAAASELLNFVMFAMSLIVALGTAFLAGPTVSGELESGIALAVLARPVRRSTVLLGKWLGLSAFACGYVAVAGTAQFVVVGWMIGYWPSSPLTALVMLGAEAVAMLTLALLLSNLISSMASGVVAVGLFGAAWVAGMTGGIGEMIDNDSVRRVGVVARVVMPTDGLWNGAMHAIQAPTLLSQIPELKGFPFLSAAAPTTGYLVWAAVWVAAMLGLCVLSLARRDI